MAEEKILLSVSLDKEQLVAALTEIKAKLAENSVVTKELKEQLKTLGAAGDTAGIQKLNEQLVLTEAKTKLLTNSQRQLQTTLLQVTQANNAAKGSYEQILRLWQLSQTQLKLLEGTLKQNVDGTLILTDAYIQAAKETNALKDAVDRFNLGVSDGRTNVGNYGKSLGGLTGAVTTARQEHKSLGSVMQGTMSVMSLMNIISGDNAKITDAQKTAMIALVAIQAISQIKLGALSAAQIFTSTTMKVTTAATVVQTTATGALASLQTFLQVQLGLTAAAARVLAIAIAATGIGLLVVAVGLLIAAFSKLSSEVSGVTAEITDHEVEIEKLGIEYLKLTGRISETEAAMLTLGATHEQVLNKIERDAETKLASANTWYRKFFDGLAFITKWSKSNADQQAEIEKAAKEESIKALEIYNAKMSNIHVEAWNKEQEDKKKQEEDDLKARDDAFKKRLEQQKKNEEKFSETMVKEIEDMKAHVQLIEDVLDEFDPTRNHEKFVDAVLADNEILIAAEKAYTDAMKIESAKRTEIQQKTVSAFNDLELSKAEFAAQGAGILMQAFKKTSVAYKALFLFQKGSAVAQILIRLQEEIAGISAANAILGAAGIPITIAQSLAAKIRAAIGIASIVATTIPAFAKSGLTGKRITSQDGIPVQRNNGDNLLATVKVGEVILNEEHQRKLGGDAVFRALRVPGFALGGTTLMDGGAAFRSVTPIIDSGTSILEQIRDKSPIVRVVDINNVQGNVARVTDNATI